MIWRLRLRNNPFDDVIRSVTHPRLADREHLELVIRQAFDENFAREASGDGIWPPLQPATIADRLRRGFGPGPILVRSGRLRRSWLGGPGSMMTYVQRADGFRLLVGSGSEIAPWHEFGTHTIPARTVATLDDAQLDAVARRVEQMIERLANAG